MTAFTLTLPQRQARIVALAFAYHLGRPGSEVDPETFREHDYGLRSVQPLLRAQLERESVALALTAYQMTRLGSAVLGALNELKMYGLLDAMAAGDSRRSVTPGFDEALRSLFPEVVADPDYASQLAADVMMLHRELHPTVRRAQEALEEERQAAEESQRVRKKGWQFWKR